MKKLHIVFSIAALFSCAVAAAIDVDEGIRQMMRRVAFYPVSNEDVSSGVITLNEKTNYKLKDNVDFPIVIDASGVVLDLNGFEVAHNDADEDVLTVNAGHSDVFIFNGRIKNISGVGTGSGVLVNNSTSNIYLRNLKIVDCASGVKLDGQYGLGIVDCELVELNLERSTIGIHLKYVDETIVQNCKASSCTQTAFLMEHCQSNCVEDCKALCTFGSASVAGFKSDSGYGNLIKGCIVKKTKTSAEDFCTKAYGILLTGTEEKTKIVDCIINETDMTSTVSAVAYGIALDPVLLETADLLTLLDSADYGGDGAEFLSVDWSPDGKYIVLGGKTPTNGSEVQIFSFDGSMITTVTGFDYGATGVSRVPAVKWSPDGKYLAVGGEDPTSGDELQIFSFNGSLLTLVDSVAYGVTGTASIWDLDWSPNGKYIAIGGYFPSGGPGLTNELQVYSFDGSNLTFVAPADYGISLRSINWSPDGKFIATGGHSSTGGWEVKIFGFTGGALPTVATYDYGTDGVAILRTVAWSPIGRFIALSGEKPDTGPGTGDELQILSFNGTSLSFVTSENYGPTDIIIYSTVWSPNGKYLVIGGDKGPGGPVIDNRLQLFSFDGLTLSLEKDVTYPTNDNDIVYGLSWSPSGRYIAAGVGKNVQDDLVVYDAMHAPSYCFANNNIVCDTNAFGFFMGTGIFGSGNSMFTSNISCNNNVNYTYGIPNVFNGDHNSQRPFDNISLPNAQ
ncbi:hypothetical protein KAH94_00755 [bacterium]|nr:hypothetical protein [bacterium]